MKRALPATILLALTAAPAMADSWSKINSPTRMGLPLCEETTNPGERCYDTNYRTMRAFRLPLRADGSHLPWTDSYWPNNKGGIAYRYATKSTPWKLARPDTVAELRAMSPEKRRALAPSEKFDIYRSLKANPNGPIDYWLTRKEINRTSPSHDFWNGICHGWSAAAINHPEPSPYTETVAGIPIEFGSSDVKALLTYYYGKYNYKNRESVMLGMRCKTKFLGLIKSKGCKDQVNPASFHIVMANQFGKFREGFVADVTKGNEVWNQPLVGVVFTETGSSGPSRESAPGTRRQIHIKADMSYIAEIQPNFSSVIGTEIQTKAERVKSYKYRLELDAEDRVIGGEWESAAEIPDFLWNVKVMKFENDFVLLNDIYRTADSVVTNRDGSSPNRL